MVTHHFGLVLAHPTMGPSGSEKSRQPAGQRRVLLKLPADGSSASLWTPPQKCKINSKRLLRGTTRAMGSIHGFIVFLEPQRQTKYVV